MCKGYLIFFFICLIINFKLKNYVILIKLKHNYDSIKLIRIVKKKTDSFIVRFFSMLFKLSKIILQLHRLIHICFVTRILLSL